ncbi:uncharacterized protein LOC128184398 [Crassostrea angulata]|uniref:uncharacterized protein LOC128184398 n=1 Tax=Magallana angulata TaxID=2784310 RepID=UPI0022B0B5A8|nr:uncharacterized protein LOC128184398 [Crassostrea angulata]
MASSPFIVSYVFLILNCFTQSFAETSEILNDNPEWKLALKKIEELQKTVKIQNDRIAMLEMQSRESSNLALTDLQNTIKHQSDQITKFEARIQDFETILATEENGPIKNIDPEPMSESNKINFSDKPKLVRKGRLLLQQRTIPAESVAFYAYFSTTIPASSAFHILAFDNVITNVGNAYHPHSGTFIAPRSGLYVFTWTIRQWGQRYHTTELLVNNIVVNSIYLNPVNTIDGGVTGTVVVQVNQGDDVLVRTGITSAGEITSAASGRSSFAGWLLM